MDRWNGLSSNAVVSIIAVIIMGYGLDKSGVLNVLANQIVRMAGKFKTRMIAPYSLLWIDETEERKDDVHPDEFRDEEVHCQKENL